MNGEIMKQIYSRAKITTLTLISKGKTSES